MISRRDFVRTASAGAAALSLLPASLIAAPGKSPPAAPVWRGFSLMGPFFSADAGSEPAFLELDYALMQEWGFNFARLPVSYWAWGDRNDWSIIREAPLKQIDQAIAWGKQYNVHTSLCIHRLPGYCINESDLEPHQLFSGPELGQRKALQASLAFWTLFAERYKGIDSKHLSFDLFNEPPRGSDRPGPLRQRTVEVTQAIIAAIRKVDPNRQLVAEGLNVGQAPIPEIADLNVIQSTRGYLPRAVSHYKAAWARADGFETDALPSWPLTDRHGKVWDRGALEEAYLTPFRAVTERGVRVHVGEWGAYNKTPHAVALRWMRDSLRVWKGAGWGWSLWNLRGSFGVLDSQRDDVKYEKFRGHALDRKMLELLRTAG